MGYSQIQWHAFGILSMKMDKKGKEKRKMLM